MAYTTVPTKNPGDLLGSLDWNTYLRDNMAYLAVRPVALAVVWVSGSYSTTSTTTVDVDGSALAVSHTNITGRVVISLLATMYASATSLATLIADIDGVDYFFGYHEIATNHRMVSAQIFVGVSVGTHTYKLQWKTSGNTINMVKDYAVRFSVMEV